MTPFLQLVSSLREQMQANLSRADVLRALIWPMSILLTATLSAVALRADDWLVILFAVLFVLNALLYGFAYAFCLLRDRDALRSERYTLHKLAIESGVYGDSRIGLIEPVSDEPQNDTKAITGRPTTAESE